MSGTIANRLTSPRIAITCLESGAGVSTVTLGLVTSLVRRSIAAAVGVIGTEVLSTTHYRRITQHFSLCLDPWALDDTELLASFELLHRGAEFVVIETKYPLLSELEEPKGKSNALEVLHWLRTPCVLVVDADNIPLTKLTELSKRIANSEAPRFIGYILNRTTGDEQIEAVKKTFSEIVPSIPYLGSNAFNPDLQKRDGTIHSSVTNPGLLSRKVLITNVEAIESSINVDELLVEC